MRAPTRKLHGHVRPLLGVSACLLGERVRHDGGHKRDATVLDALQPHVRWVPVCPEFEVGMGVPREPVHLVGDPRAPRMLGVDSGRDWTEAMRAFAERRVEELACAGIAGFVFRSRSPSCGLCDVAVHGGDGVPDAAGPGLFAAALRARLPHLPVVEDESLHDPAAAAEFLARVRAATTGSA